MWLLLFQQGSGFLSGPSHVFMPPVQPSALFGKVFLIPTDPANMKMNSPALTRGNDTIHCYFGPQQRCKCLEILEPFARWAEGVHEHDGMRRTETLGLNDRRCRAMD